MPIYASNDELDAHAKEPFPGDAERALAPRRVNLLRDLVTSLQREICEDQAGTRLAPKLEKEQGYKEKAQGVNQCPGQH